MSRIQTNVQALCATRYLARSRLDMDRSLQRLSSGLRINRGADDPAGLIASESLRSEIAGIGQAIANSQRASNVIATSEGALNEVAALLVSIQEKIIETANSGALSDDEIAANQLQVDSAVDSITRIANTTEFAGTKLLNGSRDYLLSGVDADKVTGVQVHRAHLDSTGILPVQVHVIASAQEIQGFYWNSGSPAQLLWPQPCGTFFNASSTLQIGGSLGSASLYFPFHTGFPANIVSAVNQAASTTGVTAALVSSDTRMRFITDGFLTVRQIPYCTNHEMAGPDGVVREITIRNGAYAVVTINGVTTVVGEDQAVTINSPGLNL